VLIKDWLQLLLDLQVRGRESEKRVKQLEKENKRIADLESRLDALWLNADSSSQAPPETGFN
jgi:hypothetical protein